MAQHRSLTGTKEGGMSKALAINGSPRTDKGDTALVLTPFIQGMMDAGTDVELVYASRLKINPCSCGEMYCWNETPGECCFEDDMQSLYPRLKAADILVLATPVYIPLPGDMQNVINRLCPLIEGIIETREGRTRARFHKDVGIRKIVLVATGGWWERENFGTVVRIVQELAEDASAEFAGAVLRPHAFLMKRKGELTEEGGDVLSAVQQAGYELAQLGRMSEATLEAVSRPLMSREEFLSRYGQP
jgi:multimeric flavodoxin WrbA